MCVYISIYIQINLHMYILTCIHVCICTYTAGGPATVGTKVTHGRIRLQLLPSSGEYDIAIYVGVSITMVS